MSKFHSTFPPLQVFAYRQRLFPDNARGPTLPLKPVAGKTVKPRFSGVFLLLLWTTQNPNLCVSVDRDPHTFSP